MSSEDRTAGPGAEQGPEQAPSRDADVRRSPALLAVVLGIALLVVLITTTPWDTLPDGARGEVARDVSRDFAAADVALEDRYHRWLWPAVLAGTFATLIAGWVLGFTAAGARLIRTAARPLGGGWWARLVAGVAALTGVGVLAGLPFGIWRESIQRDYGIVVRDWGDFALDLGKGYGLAVASTLIALVVFYVLVRHYPRTWWAPGTVLAALLVIGASYLYPVVVEPTFNDFTSLAEGELRTSLLELADRAGVQVDDVLVADESTRTTRLNAYVSGIGSSRRIVLYDTTIAALTPAEIESIMAHELGHVTHDDVLHGTLVGALGAATGVCVLFVVLSSPRLRRRADADDLSDPAGMALVLAVVTVVITLCSPAALLVSRKVEARADIDALELTRDPTTLISMQRRLAGTNLGELDPPALVTFVRSTHPSAPERIANARTWALLNGLPEPADQAGVPIRRKIVPPARIR
ncbi:MAG: M48 family metallopeptidase [Sporichthyaceae bacterium]